MLYTSGMTFAGAFAASLPSGELTLLSDRLPSAVLYVSVPGVSLELTKNIDRAFRSAQRDSTQFLGLI